MIFFFKPENGDVESSGTVQKNYNVCFHRIEGLVEKKEQTRLERVRVGTTFGEMNANQMYYTCHVGLVM